MQYRYNRSVTKVPTEGLKSFYNCKKPLKETFSICSHSYIFPQLNSNNKLSQTTIG